MYEDTNYLLNFFSNKFTSYRKLKNKLFALKIYFLEHAFQVFINSDKSQLSILIFDISEIILKFLITSASNDFC